MKGNVGKALTDARNRRNLSQESAAEILHLDPRTLSGYENGNPVPLGFLGAARIAYNAPREVYMALQQSEAGEGLLPEVRKLSKALAFIQMQHQIAQLISFYPRIIEIIEDDFIDEQEQPEFISIKENGNKTAGAIMSFILSE